MDELNFTVQVGLTFLAVFLGIPAGFWLERWIDSRRQAEDRKRLLEHLRENIAKNLRLIEQADGELRKSGTTVFYPLDLQAWPYVSPRVTILNDGKLASELDQVYYELAHLERKIDTQYKWFEQRPLLPLNDPRVNELDMMRRNFVGSSIIPHIADIQKKGSELVESIDKKTAEINNRLRKGHRGGEKALSHR